MSRMLDQLYSFFESNKPPADKEWKLFRAKIKHSDLNKINFDKLLKKGFTPVLRSNYPNLLLDEIDKDSPNDLIIILGLLLVERNLQEKIAHDESVEAFTKSIIDNCPGVMEANKKSFEFFQDEKLKKKATFEKISKCYESLIYVNKDNASDVYLNKYELIHFIEENTGMFACYKDIVGDDDVLSKTTIENFYKNIVIYFKDAYIEDKGKYSKDLASMFIERQRGLPAEDECCVLSFVG